MDQPTPSAERYKHHKVGNGQSSPCDEGRDPPHLQKGICDLWRYTVCSLGPSMMGGNAPLEIVG